jgi:hypothetical protein
MFCKITYILGACNFRLNSFLAKAFFDAFCHEGVLIFLKSALRFVPF